MNIQSRNIIDKLMTWSGLFAVAVLVLSVLVFLSPIISRGIGAFVFRGTIEYRKAMLDQFGRGDRDKIAVEEGESNKLKSPIYLAIALFERGVLIESQIDEAKKAYRSFKKMFSSEDLKKRRDPSVDTEGMFCKRCLYRGIRVNGSKKRA
ncbi:MAG: hypothetical protein V1753_05210 [Pseudomonadota bacterium]